ncbi:MAG: helix-turn-helix transcriptional regulator [Candidatus Eisenbacteria bacterium]|nr:helix-turn-helix transcriptional regulator [Candidatus Eisenbacteria bacterium]
MPSLNPRVLAWARVTAGLSPEAAAIALGIGRARGVSAVERLAQLESGARVPSRPVLLKMAKVYRRPLITFYLEEVPAAGERGEDFRSLAADQPNDEEPLVDALVRDLRVRQSFVREVLEEEGVGRLDWIGSRRQSDGAIQLVESIGSLLGLSRREYYAQENNSTAFATLREAAERAGVFVLLLGNLGSFHSALSLESFRGLTISDPIAPFIVINDGDSQAAWSFTLLHELTHLLLGQSGISGAVPGEGVERLCDQVASMFLLPPDELERFEPTGAATLDQAVTAFARARNLSSSMVAVALRRTGRVSAVQLAELLEGFRERWRASRERQRELARQREGGPNFYVVRGHRLGRALISLVGRATQAGALTTSKAAKIFGVKPKQVQNLIEGQTMQHRMGGRA